MIFYYLTLLLIPLTYHWLMSYTAFGLTPIQVLGFTAFLYAIISAPDARSLMIIRSRSTSMFLVGFAFVCVSILLHPSDIRLEMLSPFLRISTFFVATLILVDTREKLFKSFIALIIGVDVASAYMVRGFVQYSSIYSGYRPSGISGDSNYYVASAVAVLPVAYFLRKECDSKLLSLFCLVSIGTIGAGILVAQSRGGLIALAVVILMVVYQSRVRIRAIAFLCVMAILIVALSPINPIRRFSEGSSGAKASTESRLAILRTGLAMVRDRPFLGVGPMSFQRNVPVYSDSSRTQMAHNTYLAIAAEMGIPGISLFLLFCAATVKDINSAIHLHRNDFRTKSILAGVRVGFIGFLVTGVFLSLQYEKMFWVICFLVMASLRIEPIESSTENDDEFSDDQLASVAEEVVC